MKKVIPILLVFNLLLSLCIATLPASASSFSDSEITVKLSAYLGNKNTVKASLSGKYYVEEDNRILDGTYDIKVESGQLVLYKNGIRVKNYGASFTVKPNVYNEENIISVDSRKYLGTMRFEVENGVYVRPYNTLPVEDYLKGVVSQEMSPSWGDMGGMEALKAQAVAARTYAQGVSPIDDGQTDQVYLGYYWYPNTNRAVEETQGLVLRYNGKVIGANALYSSSNGGRVLSKVNSWGEASWNHIPYLQAKEDPYDAKSTAIGNANVNWTFSINKTQIDTSDLDQAKVADWWKRLNEADVDSAIITNIKNWLIANGYVNNKYEIKIVSIPELSFDINVPSNQTINGHIKINYWLRDTGTNSILTENGQIKEFSTVINTRAYTIRTMIGSTFMKSPNVKNVYDNSEKFIVTGGGWGHGIGMSQWGAFQMSQEGKGFIDILDFYYPGTTIEDVQGPTISNFSVAVSTDKVVTFNYELDEDSTTTISLVNPQKNIIVNQVQNAGRVQLTWDASTLSVGDYKFTIVWKDRMGNVTKGEGNLMIAQQDEEPRPVEESLKKITLLNVTDLYPSPNMNQPRDSAVSAQTVWIVEQQGVWFKIKTWLGDKWINPDGYRVVSEKYLKINQVESIYRNPTTSEKAASAIGPQTVNVISEIPNTGWYQIKTWLGPMWIMIKQPTNERVTLKSITKIYNDPELGEKAYSSLAPQTVEAINKIGNTGCYQVKTWAGPKWIMVKQPTNERLTLKKITEIYNDPKLGVRAYSSLAPQNVKAINKIGDTGWYEIETWVGPKWIYVN